MKTVILLLAIFCGALAAPPEDDPQGSYSAGLLEFQKGNKYFTSNLYKEVIKDVKGNFIMSPFSAEVILALTNEGAVGETSNELQVGLGLPSKRVTQAVLRKYLGELQEVKPDVKLLSANKLYVAEGFSLNPTFKDISKASYYAGVENVNFGASEQTAHVINEWVKMQTNSKIQNLIKPDSLSQDTKLILVNALYFSGKWKNPFEKYATYTEKFYKGNSVVTDVDMMHQTDSFNYCDNRELKAKFIELPYQGSDVSLVIALPDEIDGLLQLEQNVDKLLVPQNYTMERVDIKLPKFKVETEIQLKPILQQIGIKKIFSSEADLSGITSSKGNGLYVDQVVQKAFIKVNEDGTEAAAATAVKVWIKSLRQYKFDPIPFVANHPFFYFIQKDGVILFVGYVNL